MTKEEIIELLKSNIKVKVGLDYDYSDYYQLKVSILMDDVEIDSDYIYITDSKMFMEKI